MALGSAAVGNVVACAVSDLRFERYPEAHHERRNLRFGKVGKYIDGLTASTRAICYT